MLFLLFSLFFLFLFFLFFLLTTLSSQFRQLKSVNRSVVGVLKRLIGMSALLGLVSISWANLSTDSVFLKTQSARHTQSVNSQNMQQTSSDVMIAKQQPRQIDKALQVDGVNEVKEVKESKEAKAKTLIGQLAQSGYALIFFFHSSCGHCHQFAPIVKSVSTKYGFYVFDFSFDNQGLPSFPTPATVTQAIYRAYYGNAKPFYPVLILQNVNTMEFYVVAQGNIPERLLEQHLNQYAKELLRDHSL
ncbi:conjugal transfer protein TraF [Fastidiosibacter lacustris]|uniref:conjugal transfer protein TraF n=1 Tax=Fastidiosibacter lacustris TaxID=2056695 RepID=UPI000E356D02|nr:conjugal transfer protein TraF [Fastidiosibacter lacustris]